MFPTIHRLLQSHVNIFANRPPAEIPIIIRRVASPTCSTHLTIVGQSFTADATQLLIDRAFCTPRPAATCTCSP